MTILARRRRTRTRVTVVLTHEEVEQWTATTMFSTLIPGFINIFKNDEIFSGSVESSEGWNVRNEGKGIRPSHRAVWLHFMCQHLVCCYEITSNGVTISVHAVKGAHSVYGKVIFVWIKSAFAREINLIFVLFLVSPRKNKLRHLN